MDIFQLKKSYLNNRIPKTQYIVKMFQFHKLLYNYTDVIKDTDIEKIEITKESVIITNKDNVKLICDKEDRRLVPIEIINFGSFEKQEMEISLQLIENGFTIFDIGANYGWYSLHFEKQFPKSKIYAFEPVPKTFKYLEKNITLNKAKNIKACNFGFSDKKEERALYFSPSESGSSSFADMQEINKPEKILCEMTTLDNFLKSTKTKVDFIKCDVEGAELFVFKGGLKSIEKHKPIIFSEMLRKWSAKLNYHPNKIIKMMDEIGYACYFIENGKLIRLKTMTDDTIPTNFFFLHLKKHTSKIKKFT